MLTSITMGFVKLHLLLLLLQQQVLSAVLQAGVIFQAINWLLFLYISEQKVQNVIKHPQHPEYEASAHYARQTIIICLLRQLSLKMKIN